MTSNHHGSPRHTRPVSERPEGALLAGVCAALANRLGWNVWAIRVLFAFGLFIQTIGTGVVYIILAALLPKYSKTIEKEEPALKADELSTRNERIADLERRFKEMERETGN